MIAVVAAVVALLAAAAAIVPAAAQNFGNIAPQTVIGNLDPVASKPAQPMPFTSITSAKISNSSFYAGQTPAPILSYLNNRIFLGTEASKNTGGINITCADTTACDWLSNTNVLQGIYTYLDRSATVESISQSGLVGGLFASRSSDQASAPIVGGGKCCLMSAAFVGYNDMTGARKQDAWNIYSSGVRAAGAGALVNEWDMANLGNNAYLNPYTVFDPGGVDEFTIGLALNAGGETAPQCTATGSNCQVSAALMVNGNGQTFLTGIVVRSGAIGAAKPVALDMPEGNYIAWSYDNTTNWGAFLTSSNGAAATASGLDFTSTGPVFSKPDGTIMAKIAFLASSVSFPLMQGSVAGQPVMYTAAGSDTNIGVLLFGKGNTGGLELDSNGISFRYGSGAALIGASLTNTGDFIFGPNVGTIAPTATSPFFAINTMTGLPTASPAGAAIGNAQLIIDVTDHKLCWHEAPTGWKCVAGS